MEIEIYFQNEPWAGTTKCYIVRKEHTGERFVAEPMELKFSRLVEAHSTAPSLSFDRLADANSFFKALAEGLKEAGYSIDTDEGAIVDAQKIHLQDLRNIVMKVLEGKDYDL